MNELLLDLPPAGATPDWRSFVVDDLDRRVIAALQVSGRATWKEIAGALSVPEPTLARRGRRLLDLDLVRVVAFVDPLRSGLGFPALVRISCEPTERGHLAEVIKRREDVRLATTVMGPTDLVAEFVVPSTAALVNILRNELPGIRGVTGTETLSVTHTYRSHKPWEESILSEEELQALSPLNPQVAAERWRDAPACLDDIDYAIIAALAEDGRMSAKAIAATAQTSESTVARRIDRLATEGCIFFTVVSPAAMLGFTTELLVWLRVDSARIEEAARILMRHPGAKYLWVTTGRFNLCASLHFRHLGELFSFETQVLGALPSVTNVEINTHLTSLKRAWLELYPSSMSGPSESAGRAVRALLTPRE